MALFYQNQIDAALQLSREQVKDGWTKDQVGDYWSCLGYDVFWVVKLLKLL